MKSVPTIVIQIFAVLTMLLFFSKASAQQDTILTAYNNQTEITGKASVTLKDGFYIPAGKTVWIHTTGISFKNCVPFAGIPSTNQNYISTKVFKVPGVLTDTDVNATGRSICDVNQTIQYFDGLGRLLQTVTTQGSPGFKDLVQPVAYDAFGREATKYLPYMANGAVGSYRADAVIGTNNAQKIFYGLTGQNYPTIASPFNQTVFEASPLNRVMEQGAPGDTWQPAASRTNLFGRTIVTEYGTNATEVKLWTVTSNGASTTTPYSGGKLYKTTLKDENWVPANEKGGTVDEYKDFEEHVVLKRVWESDAKSLSTYYLYDDFGNLRYVLPPAVNENGQSTINSFTESDAAFNQFIYGYHYDDRKRLIEKKVPGKGWERMVYNKLDQVVLSQDSVQKTAGQWYYSKFDAFGRTVISGIYTSSSNRSALQLIVDGQTGVLWESRIGQEYTNITFPLTGTEPQLVNYYDDYNILNIPNNQSASYSKKLKTLLTATKVKVLGTANDYLWTVNYYDEEARIVKVYKQHYLGGVVNATNYDEIDNTYNFAGELTASNRVHHAGTAVTTIANRYEFDHMGRKMATFEKINGDSEVVLSKLNYNDVGQLLKKSIHSTDGTNFLQFNTYAYNSRGWMKKNTAGLFSFELQYEDGSIPQFNGNIANQKWGVNGTNPNTYTYGYDKLNRLINGTSTGVTMSEALIYDEMGNIKSLVRDGAAAGTYSFIGNQLKQVTGGISTGIYSYDGNGNAKIDGRNGVSLTYNILNLPAVVTKTGLTMAYTYDASGSKLRNVSNGAIRDYISGIEYNAGTIEIIHTEEGLARRNGTSYSYEYNLTDHLGNVRLSFYKNPVSNALETIQKDDYYPFGQRKTASAGQNKYLYNGKELQEELGQLDYGARFYDPVIGRWNVVDPFSEKMRRHSPYNYGFNNPIRFVDPDGMISTDIWKFDTETKELSLVRETKDKFDTFINQNGKIITKTNDKVEDSQKNIDNYGGAAKSKSWLEDLGELGKAISSNQEARNTMMDRAKENGYESTGTDRLVKVGERKVWSDRIGFVRDEIAGKFVGPSSFKMAKDILDKPKSYSDITGRTIGQDANSVLEFVKGIPGSTKDAYEKMIYEIKAGVNSLQNGNFRKF